MHHLAGRFVDHHEVCVVEDDVDDHRWGRAATTSLAGGGACDEVLALFERRRGLRHDSSLHSNGDPRR